MFVCVLHLSGTVAAQSLQVLSVCEVAGQSSVLKGDPGVDEGRRPTVVVHEE